MENNRIHVYTYTHTHRYISESLCCIPVTQYYKPLLWLKKKLLQC